MSWRQVAAPPARDARRRLDAILASIDSAADLLSRRFVAMLFSRRGFQTDMQSPLTRNEVNKVALLARLKLSEQELEKFTLQLGQVLGYVAILNEIDTQDVEPMSHAVELCNVFRDDVVQKSLSREQALANAPKTDGHCFLVPPILEGE